MAHLFECPYCAARTMVKPEFLGQSGPCAECGQIVTVPLPADRKAAGAPRANNRGWWPLFLAMVCLTVLGGVVIGVFVFGVFLPASKTTVIQTQTAASSRNLAKIAQALRDYEKLHGRFPPAFTVDEFGQPMHSWRVMILPQLGYRDLYRKYDFSKSWDSKENLKLRRLMPPEFASPDDPSAAMTWATNYFAICGPTSMFPGKRGLKAKQIRDGLANTLMLIEVDSSIITWTQPVDYTPATQTFTDSTVAQNQRRIDSFLAATADGKPHLLPAGISSETKNALISASGGEPETVSSHALPIGKAD